MFLFESSAPVLISLVYEEADANFYLKLTPLLSFYFFRLLDIFN